MSDKLWHTNLITVSCSALILASGQNACTLSLATSAFDLPTCSFRNRNCRLRLLKSIVSRSIWRICKRNTDILAHHTQQNINHFMRDDMINMIMPIERERWSNKNLHPFAELTDRWSMRCCCSLPRECRGNHWAPDSSAVHIRYRLPPRQGLSRLPEQPLHSPNMPKLRQLTQSRAVPPSRFSISWPPNVWRTKRGSRDLLRKAGCRKNYTGMMTVHS